MKIDGPHLDSWTLQPAATSSSSFPPPPIPPPPPSPPSPPLPYTGPNPSWFCWFIWPRVWKRKKRRLSSHFSTPALDSQRVWFCWSGRTLQWKHLPIPAAPRQGLMHAGRGMQLRASATCGIPCRNSHTAFSGCEQVRARLTERQRLIGKEKKRGGVLKNRRFKSRASAGFYVSLDTCAEGFPLLRQLQTGAKHLDMFFLFFLWSTHACAP